MFNRPIIWCLIGPSGCGKDTVARMLAEDKDWNVLCSYTTRPMRMDEQNGREHLFISIKEYLSISQFPNNMLAHTLFGDHHYFTIHSQIVRDRLNLYIIDEKGFLEMREKFGSMYELNVLHMISSMSNIRSRGVEEERMLRDQERISLRHELVQEKNIYQFVIENNGTLAELSRHVSEFSRLAKEMIYE